MINWKIVLVKTDRCMIEEDFSTESLETYKERLLIIFDGSDVYAIGNQVDQLWNTDEDFNKWGYRLTFLLWSLGNHFCSIWGIDYGPRLKQEIQEEISLQLSLSYMDSNLKSIYDFIELLIKISESVILRYNKE